MNFIKSESCGKCIPCREGTKQMLNILEGVDMRGFGFGSAEHIHYFTEAKKLVYADRGKDHHWNFDDSFDLVIVDAGLQYVLSHWCWHSVD